MLYIPRNRKLEIAPGLSKAHRRQIAKYSRKQGRVLSPLSCSLFSPLKWAGMRQATQRRRGQLDGSVATQQPPSLHSQVQKPQIILQWKKSRSCGNMTASTSPVRCALGHRALSLHCHQTELWQDTQDEILRFPWRKIMS